MNELETIDAVLRDEPVPPEHADLAALVREVRADAPEIRPAFEQRLEKRVEQGFPKQPRRDSTRRGPSLLAPSLALACTILIAGVFVFAGVVGNGGDDAIERGQGDSFSESGGGESGSSAAPATKSAPRTPPAAGAPGAFTSESQPLRPAQRDGTLAAPGRPRVVTRNAALTLRAPEDDFAEVTDGVLTVADDAGAVVQRSTVTERAGRGYARYDLRVPTSRLDETLAALSRLADVRSRNASTDDITGAYVSARDRLDDARAERRALLRRLARADSENEADAIRASLRDARRRIALAERDVRRVRAQADRARLDVTVESTGASGAWTPGDAVDDAGRVLEVMLGVLLVALAILGPLAVLAALLVASSRVARRRRREAALRPGG